MIRTPTGSFGIGGIYRTRLAAVEVGGRATRAVPPHLEDEDTSVAASYDAPMTAIDDDVRELVEQLHATPALATLAVTGAGSQALAWLFGVGGASRTVLEATVPYAAAATSGYIGFEPTEFASLEVAAALARGARLRSTQLVEDATTPLIGLGCSAAIATDRTKRGDHRAFVGVDLGDDRVTTYALNLKKGTRERAGEEALVSRLILNALASASGIRTPLDLALLPDEQVLTNAPSGEPGS